MTASRTGMLVATLAVVLAATACGGDGDGDDQTQPRPRATVTVTQSVASTTEGTPSTAPATSPPSTPSTTGTPTSAPASQEGGADLSRPPTTYAEGMAHVAAARDVTQGGARELTAFVSPSGNIYCGLDQPGQDAACEISQGLVDDPSACPDNPMTTRVGRIEIQGDRAVPICNTDTIVLPGAPVLSYGTSATTRDTVCVSEQIGVTCLSRGAETGFFLARGRFTLLGS